MVIIHSYVSLPEGNSATGKKCRAGSQIGHRHLVVLLQILCLSRYHVHMGVGPYYGKPPADPSMAGDGASFTKTDV